MKKVFIILIALSLTACFHSKKNPPPPQTGSVTVEGNIKNESLAWHNYLPEIFKNAFAADFISTRSSLTVTDPERILDVSKSSGVLVDANVINSTAQAISGFKVDVFIEDEVFLTKENWSCAVCYPFDGGGADCEVTWSVDGNTIFETEPAPTLPLCQAGQGTQELCVTKFKDGVDCSSPTYSQEYTEPGKGLQELTISNVSVAALSNFVSSVGIGANNWQTGSNKYARFIVYNQSSVEVFRKDYVFNVVE